MRKHKLTVAGKVATVSQWASIMMLTALGIGLIWVNSPLKIFYDLFHHTPVAISFGGYALNKPLVVWINDGLMAFFFLAVTLEIKREVLEGHLSSMRQMLLPAFAALGGMIVPAVIYLVLNGDNPDFARGWSIPTATDIALSLAILSLFGNRVPVELRVFLAALAIFDDLGGILIIALFYGSHLSFLPLIFVAAGLVALFLLNKFGVTHASLYVVIGLFLWIALQQSGIHPTLSGVAVAVALPLRVPRSCSYVPLKIVEDGMRPWVAFFIVPLFAFFNAGIVFSEASLEHLQSPVLIGIAAGLFIGKPLGIFMGAWLAYLLNFADLMVNVTWGQIFGVALLGGIGFTMALFFNAVAFPYDGLSEVGRLAVLIGSILSGLAGYLCLDRALPINK